jgi:hypothetical protein
MKEKTKVVYVPDAHKFILGEFFMYDRPIGDPALNSLRKNYAELRQRVNLPEKVGVVTYSGIIKRECQRHLAELEPDESKRHTAHYIPLEALERMLKIREELNADSKNSLTREYAYRMLSVLASNSLILLDKDRPQQAGHLMTACGIPHAMQARDILIDVQMAMKDKMPGSETSIQEAIDNMNSMTSWQGIEQLHSLINARFALNKVSREFPLHFQPRGWMLPALYEVSLVERVEIGKGYDYFVDLLSKGYRASGQGSLPEAIRQHLDQLYKKDKFGSTIRAERFGELLLSLPEPRTIVTDVYIADAFPEIAETDFESVEIR